MTLNFFQKPAAVDGQRSRAVNCVRTWLWGKSHLPADLRRSLYYLIPELTEGVSDQDNEGESF